MPIGDQQTRSRRYSASVAEVSSIDDPTNSTTSSYSGRRSAFGYGGAPRSLHTRIVTTHVEGSATKSRHCAVRSHRNVSAASPAASPATTPCSNRKQFRLINGFDVIARRARSRPAGHERPTTARISRPARSGRNHAAPSPARCGSTVPTASGGGQPAYGTLEAGHSRPPPDRHARQPPRPRRRRCGRLPSVVIGQVCALLQRTGPHLHPPAASRHCPWTCSPVTCCRTGTRTGSCSNVPGYASCACTRSRHLAACSVGAGRYAEAVDAGLAAVAADVLRESAHRGADRGLPR